MSPDEVLSLTAERPRRRCVDGEAVVHLGDDHTALYVLESGALSVERNGNRLALLDEPGAIVGELGMLLDLPASADVIALGDTTVREVADAAALFAEVPEFARFVATTVARRLYRIVGFLDDLQEQFADRPGTLGLVPAVLEQLLADPEPALDPGSEREPDAPY